MVELNIAVYVWIRHREIKSVYVVIVGGILVQQKGRLAVACLFSAARVERMCRS